MKEIKDDTNRCKDIWYGWIGMINIVKNDYINQNDYTNQSNLQVHFFVYHITSGILHKTQTKKFHNLYGNTIDPE